MIKFIMCIPLHENVTWATANSLKDKLNKILKKDYKAGIEYFAIGDAKPDAITIYKKNNEK